MHGAMFVCATSCTKIHVDVTSAPAIDFRLLHADYIDCQIVHHCPLGGSCHGVYQSQVITKCLVLFLQTM